MTPNLTAGNNPVGTLNTGYNGTRCDLRCHESPGIGAERWRRSDSQRALRVRQMNSVVSADYRVNRTNSLEAAYERENFRRQYRERDKTWEDKVRLGYVNRGFEAGTLRLAYEYGPPSRKRPCGGSTERVLQRPRSGRSRPRTGRT